MIKPSIGCVVWYYQNQQQVQPFAMLVCYVHSDRLVNLGGFNDGGATISRSSTTLLQDDDKAPEAGGYATWMPYQVGQAKANMTEAK